MKKQGKEAPPVVQEKKPEPEPPKYEEPVIDVNEFHQKYNTFLKDDEENKKRQAEYLGQFMDNTGLSMAFKIICAEVLSKNLSPEDVLPYTSGRLKELGKELEKMRSGTSISNASGAHGAGQTVKVPPKK